MSIVITPSILSDAARAATATPVVLQPGSVISARVQQVLTGDTVRIAIGSQTIDVLSQVPLQAGQTLQLAVSQSSDGTVRLALVNPQDAATASQGAGQAANANATSDTVTLAPDAAASIATPATTAAFAPKLQLTAEEAAAVSVAAQTAATQQTSLAPLFANLSVAAGLDSLPSPVQQAVAQVLTQRTNLDQNLTGADIEQAFQSSGLFLEASLASGSFSSSAATPDLKAALVVLRQVLVTSLNGATAAQGVAAPLTTSNTLPPAVPVGTTSPAAVPTAATGQPGAAAILVDPGAAAVALTQAAPPPIQGPLQAFTFIGIPDTLTTPSQALTPLLTSGIAAPAVLLSGTAVPILQDAANLSAVSQIILPPSTPADAAARAATGSAVLNLLQETVQASPQIVANPSALMFENSAMLSLLPALTGQRPLRADDAEFARTNVPPPPVAGALPAPQAVMPATIVSNSPFETAMHHLIADTEGAIARQTLLQVASLPDRVDIPAARLDPGAPRWNFEIPFVTPQGTAMAQFEISRDGGGNEVRSAARVWRARFSLDVEPAGPVHALVMLNGDKTSVRMWAERPATAAQLRAGAAQLSQALSKAELTPGDIVIRDGTPPQPAPARAGHFLDRAL